MRLLRDPSGSVQSEIVAACTAALARANELARAHLSVLHEIRSAPTSQAPELTAKNAALYDSARLVPFDFRDSVARILGRITADSISSGMNAHYAFSAVAPGTYALFSEWQIADRHYTWLAPAVVRAGAALKIDLDNSKLSDLAGCDLLNESLRAW